MIPFSRLMCALPILPLCFVLAAAPGDDLADGLKRLAATWKQDDALATARENVRGRIREANERESAAWHRLSDKAGWEKYRDQRLTALGRSLGTFPDPPRDLKVRIRKTLTGDGYRIDNLTFESRPGLVVTANLYGPTKAGKAMPGILLVHSHHNPKTQGELQDMGILWARAGCLVLVMDQLGHGERRQHPFRDKDDFPKPFQVGRQDYHMRHNVAITLQTIGDSLMGWMVWDIHRSVDLLLSRPGIDPKRIALFGAVAGGGDPCAVAGALDPRINVVGPFNFGGPQPETRYPLPEDAETSFNYAGSGSWETTRNLYRSARDGFLPWVIVGAVAPRRHVYGHEFSWDRQRDPVWKRLERIHGWYGAPGHLAFSIGTGLLSGKPPESSHCNNIGAIHRKGSHAALKAWWGLEAREPDKPERRPAAELLCLGKDEKIKKAHELAAEIAEARLESARQRLAGQKPEEQRRQLRADWARLLGDVEPAKVGEVARSPAQSPGEGVRAEWVGLPGVPWVWMLLLSPKSDAKQLPVTVFFGQGGPRTLLSQRAADIAALLKGGSAVAVLDLGGTSAVPPGADRGRRSGSTSLAASELMLGQTMLGTHLRGLRAAIRYLWTRSELDSKRISLWGDSMAPANAAGARLEVPLELTQPHQAEPLGGVLALLGALFEDGIASVRGRGGLVGYRALLGHAFCHVPYDVVVPGALTAGDLCDVAMSLAPVPVRLEGLVDGLNRRVPAKEAEKVYAGARRAYREAKAEGKLELAD